MSCRTDIAVAWQTPAGGQTALKIDMRGLRGGHCEFDIHFDRANAITVLGRLLRRAMQTADIQIATVSGGVQNNVIPAESSATILVPIAQTDAVEAALTHLIDEIASEFRKADPDMIITVSRVASAPDRVFSARAAGQLVRTIALLPDGILHQNLDVPDNWETSNNIGFMVTTGTRVEITCTITSAVTSRKHAVLDQILQLAEMAGDGVTATQIGLDAPEFPWNPESYMLSVAKQSYERVMGRKPDVLVSVCSLELGMFTQRIAGLDTIGIGTNLYDLHSARESMDHTSAARVWPLIKDVMRNLNR